MPYGKPFPHIATIQNDVSIGVFKPIKIANGRMNSYLAGIILRHDYQSADYRLRVALDRS
jgi:hypothetical protein